MKVLKWLGVSIGVFILWLVVLGITRQVAYEYVSFLASSVTNSCASKLSFSCGYFEWDNDLKVASYISYAVIFILLNYMTITILKRTKSKQTKLIVIASFVMSFPTYTNWGVTSICGGFGGCATGYHIGVIVPLIMTADIFTLPSALIACGLAWAYLYITKSSIS